MLCSQSKKKKSSKIMRRRERGDVLVAPEIPLDLVIEIGKRLPIKSLARFKCVSKLWYSLISSQGSFFASPPRLYISSRVKGELLSFSLASTSKSRTVFNLDLTKQVIGGYNMVSLRGLILYTVYVSRRTCIYNPTTGQKVTLPAILSEDKVMSNYFLGYDPVLDQYKVVCTSVVVQSVKPVRRSTQHWVFVLEAGSSWKKIEFEQPHIPTRRGLCINGMIYYFAFSYEYEVNLISFDIRSEEFSMIELPHRIYEDWKFLGVIEYDGKPTIFDYKHLREDSLVNLWVLEDNRKWSRKSLVLQSCHMHFFPYNIDYEVIGTTQNSEVVLKPVRMYSRYYILYYNLHKNDVRRVFIRGISEEPLHLALIDSDNIMHLKI